MAGNGRFDGTDLLRGLNIGLDQDNRKLRTTINDLAQRNMMTIALIRTLIRKFGVEGTISLSRDEINNANVPNTQPIFYMKNEVDAVRLSLNPEGPQGAGQKQIITLDNA